MDAEKFPDGIGKCGVCCAILPCYLKNCKGCGCSDRDQKRISKWKCKIRICVEEKQILHCGECGKLTCKIRKDLDKRYLTKYGIDLSDNIRRLTLLGPDRFIADEKKTHTCIFCGGLISPYTRECSSCKKINP